MLNRTYSQEYQAGRAAQGLERDSLTTVLCGNTAGHMIKLGLICEANNPEDLKDKTNNRLAVCWQHNKKV